MKRTLKITAYTFLFVFLIASYIFFKRAHEEYSAISSFDTCVEAGYPVLSTYPEQCKMPGKIFTNSKQTAEEQKIVDVISKENTSPKNTTYILENEMITLIDGESIIDSSTSSSLQDNIKYYGKELRIDLNEDGRDDSAFLITRSSSETGIFYYLVVALNKENGYMGTNGLLLGDRIEPVSNQYKNGEIVISYLDRLTNEPITKTPSHTMTKHFKIMNETLVEISE